jgi:transposase
MHEHQSQDQTAIRTDLGAIFVSLELSRSTWLITSLSPGAGERLSKHSVSAGDVGGLLARLAQLQQKAAARLDRTFPVIAIQEAGLDGFWIHRVLGSEGIESHVVDAASILVSRRRRQAKTDRIDGETLVRTSWPTNVVSLGCARWSGRRRRKRKIGDVSAASGRRCLPSASSTPTGLKDYSAPRASSTMTRSCAPGAPGWMIYGPETDGPCQPS